MTVQETQKKTGGSDLRSRMVKEIEKILKAPSLFVTRYQGLSVKDLEELRGKLRSLSGRYLIAKNTLSSVALKSVGREDLVSMISGQTGFVVSEGDPLAVSKILVGYAKDHEALKLCGGIVEGEILTADRLREFAKLPPREMLIGETVFLMKSPLSQVTHVLSETVRKLLYALEAISKKKELEEAPQKGP